MYKKIKKSIMTLWDTFVKAVNSNTYKVDVLWWKAALYSCNFV